MFKQTPLALMRFVARALLNAAGAGIAGDLAVDVLPDLAVDVWAWWSQDRNEDERRAEVAALAQAPAAEVRQVVTQVLQETAADQPPAVQQFLTQYLTQMPAAIRRSLRRPTDPTGATVPSGLSLQKPEDLLVLLPDRLPRFQPGDHPLNGVDWELVELLGTGGFGEVWKARNPHLASARPAALKFCLNPSAAKVLRHEAAVLDRVMHKGRHPGIVQLQHTYLSADPPCLEYEYVDGGDLAGLIHQWHRNERQPPPQITELSLRLIRDLAEVVAFAHQVDPPIVHRDLKPANILVQSGTNGQFALRVADFGIGGVAAGRAIDQTRSGATRGSILATAVRGAYTPLYASPQQVRGEPPDPRDDVHALGVIWYQLLTGDLSTGAPAGLEWPDELRQQGMTDAQVRLLAACIEGRAEKRLANAVVLAERLAATAPGGTTKPIPVPEEPPSPALPLAPPAPGMRRFQFVAVHHTEKKVKEMIDATNEGEALHRLNQMGYFVTTIAEVKSGPKDRSEWWRA